MKSQMLKKTEMVPTKIGRGLLLTTTLLILAAAWPARAEREEEKGKKDNTIFRARTVQAKPIGNPTWTPVDFQLFTAPIGTAASGYAEFGTTINSLLPPPNHQFCSDLGGPGPGAPHSPPYTGEMSAGVAALGFTTGPHFRPVDFSTGNGVYCAWMNIPSPGVNGSSPDFASGPIIPNTFFPIHVSGTTYKNGQLINPFLGTFDVPPLSPALSCAFTVAGHSHFPIFFADNLDFMPPGTDPVGSWEFRITMTDSGGNGWTVSARFSVSGPKPHIVPPNAKYRGLSYGEWGAQWWKSVFSIPVVDGHHPVISGGAFGEDQDVLFLAGVGGGATIDITIPPGTPIFFPVVNSECSVVEPDPFHGDDEAELRTCANGHIDHTSGLFAMIDGWPVNHLERYRVQSPLFEFGPLPPHNLLNAPAGTTSAAVDAGVYVLLEPLNEGQHTIRFGGTFDQMNFSIDTTYHVTVRPNNPPQIYPPQSKPHGKSYAEWLSIYWRWIYSGADLAQSKFGHVQLMPIPASEYVSGAGTPADPSLLRGHLEITLPQGTPFVLPAFAWISERYDGYPAEPDDLPVSDNVLLAGVHPDFTIDGFTVLSDANKADFYTPNTPFDPIVVYPAPSSYGSVAAIAFQSSGIVSKPLRPGRHVIRLYETYIIPAGAYPPLPDGFGIIYDNTWIVTVTAH